MVNRCKSVGSEKDPYKDKDPPPRVIGGGGGGSGGGGCGEGMGKGGQGEGGSGFGVLVASDTVGMGRNLAIRCGREVRWCVRE
jgi:hypothetical protein